MHRSRIKFPLLSDLLHICIGKLLLIQEIAILLERLLHYCRTFSRNSKFRRQMQYNTCHQGRDGGDENDESPIMFTVVITLSLTASEN